MQGQGGLKAEHISATISQGMATAPTTSKATTCQQPQGFAPVTRRASLKWVTAVQCLEDQPSSSTEGWPTAACLLCRDSPAQAIWEAYDQLRRMHLHDAPPQLGPTAKRLQVSQAGYRSEDGGLTPWC